MKNLIEQILEKEKINYKELKKSTSGFTNIVYFIDDSLVIKLTNDEETKKQLEKEILIYQNLNIDNIPRYITSGEIDNYKYLIISKVAGKTLYSIWHKLTNYEREKAVKQIADILNNFNKVSAKFLPPRYCFHNWKCYIIEKLTNRVSELKENGFDSKIVEDFIKHDCYGLFDENVMGLVYNDAHFDNFLYDNGKLTLIDFDRVIYGAIDYEMLIFKTMCDNPLKFASEEDENIVFEEHFVSVYSEFKRNYPELFKVKNIEERIKIYQFNYLLRQALNMKNREVGNVWAKELLDDFKIFMQTIK